MFELSLDIQLLNDENDLVACNLLKRVEPFEQFVIMNSIDNIFLQRILKVAIHQEEYELRQHISELLKGRKNLN